MGPLRGLEPAARRRRPSTPVLVGLGVLVVVLLVEVGILLGGGGSGTKALREGPPADAAAKLVPAGALVYAHVSTDTGRGPTARGLALIKRVPGLEAQRVALVRRLSAPRCGIDLAKLGGDEAALAVLDAGNATAATLLLVDVGEGGDVPERACGTLRSARFGRFAAIGQAASIAAARALSEGRGKALADDAGFKASMAALPQDRAADVWATAVGVQDVLVPQAGLVGLTGNLVAQPGLRTVALGFAAADGGARVVARTRVVAREQPRQIAPVLPGRLPANPVAYVGGVGLGASSGRLLALAGAGTDALAGALRRAGGDLAPLARVYAGEVGTMITAAGEEPLLSLVAPTTDEAASLATLRRLQPALARLLRGNSGSLGTWRETKDGGGLTRAGRVVLAYGVFGGKVVLSTEPAGVENARRGGPRLADQEMWRKAIGNAPNRVGSVVLLDFSRLLRLSEQQGTSSGADLLGTSGLEAVRAVGARSSGSGAQTTTELLLSIP